MFAVVQKLTLDEMFSSRANAVIPMPFILIWHQNGLLFVGKTKKVTKRAIHVARALLAARILKMMQKSFFHI